MILETGSVAGRKKAGQKILRRMPHKTAKMLMPYPIYIPKAMFDEWFQEACDIANSLYPKAQKMQGRYPLPEPDSESEFFAVDCAVIRDEDGKLTLRLIETQTFATVHDGLFFLESLFQSSKTLMGGRDMETRKSMLDKCILGDQDPKHVVMLDEHALHQGSGFDFVAASPSMTPRSVLDVFQFNNKWHYLSDSGPVEIKRVYNRCVYMQMTDAQKEHFDNMLSDPRLEWVNHPSWWYAINKGALQNFKHPYNPPCHDLSSPPPEDLSKWILKKHDDYANKGVILNPTKEDVEAAKNETHMLQSRVEFENVVDTKTVEKPSLLELRFAMIREGGEYVPLTTMARIYQSDNMNADLKSAAPGAGITIALPK